MTSESVHEIVVEVKPSDEDITSAAAANGNNNDVSYGSCDLAKPAVEARPRNVFPEHQRSVYSLFCFFAQREMEDNGGTTWAQTMYLAYQTIGIIYGDIGTSPLYCLSSVFQTQPTQDDIIGVLSCVIWSILIVVIFKYVMFVLTADDHGEGGTFALYSMLSRGFRETITNKRTFKRINNIISFGAIAGVALVLSDGMLTPAISVISAMEGLEIVSPNLSPAVLPLSVAILFGLFMMQRFGTSKVSHMFSPFIMLWFMSLTGIGIWNITQAPQVLVALSPHYAFLYFAEKGYYGWAALASIVLCVTGAEALFADMGHFSRASIRLSSAVIVVPSLIVCYLGQGAALSIDPTIYASIFYRTTPSALVIPMIVLATIAAIIASQAMISASFSLMYQASRLQFFPHMTVKHTDYHNAGQIYIPEINYCIMIGSILVSLIFQHSTNLTFAYGFAVCTVFLITTMFFSMVIVVNFKWHWVFAVAFFLVFGVVDGAFLSANLLKFPTGGWFPFCLAVVFTSVMCTWGWGRRRMIRRQTVLSMQDEDLFQVDKFRKAEENFSWQSEDSTKVLLQAAENDHDEANGMSLQPGLPLPMPTVVVMVPNTVLICYSSVRHAIPATFVHFLRCMPARPEHLVFVTITQWQLPVVEDNFTVVPLTDHRNVYRAQINAGYLQPTPQALPLAARILRQLSCLPEYIDKETATDAQVLAAVNLSFLVGRDSVVPKENALLLHVMAVKSFSLLLRMSRSIAAHLGIPVEKTLEIGIRVPI